MDYSQLDPEDIAAAFLIGYVGQHQVNEGSLSEEQFHAIFGGERSKELEGAILGSISTLGLIGSYMTTLARLGMSETRTFATLLVKVFELGWSVGREGGDWDLDNL